MDFFAAQDRARAQSRWLLVAFAAAIVCVAVLLYCVIAAVAVSVAGEHPRPFFDARLAFWTFVGTASVIVSASLWRIASLRSGGSAVAELLGGRRVDARTRDLRERQLLNVVEEMSIASGVPMPAVYILDKESGINAFAAGFVPGDAAVAVTRGALEKLTRDELQGVMGHEFSHILHGDMRLNIRLLAIVFGLLAVAVLGRLLVHVGLRMRGGRKNPGPTIAAVGFAILVIGYLGVFFGRLIQAAISRQREFLADASAVQFTRNPEGIAGALARIAGFRRGGGITHPRVEEVGHMCFASALSSLFATHPPLIERIRRLHPPTLRSIREFGDDYVAPLAPAAAVASGFEGGGGAGIRPREMREQQGAAGRLARLVGSMPAESVAAARCLLADLPESVRDAARDPKKAPFVVCALLLVDAGGLSERLRGHVRRVYGEEALSVMADLRSQLSPFLPRAAIPVLFLCLPTLRTLPELERTRLLIAARLLIAEDARVTLFEFSLARTLRRHLTRHREQRVTAPEQITNPSLVADAAHVLLATIACAGASDDAAAAAAFRAALQAAPELGVRPGDSVPRKVSTDELERALDTAAAASSVLRAAILRAAASAIDADKTRSVTELELLRCFADSLDLPMPFEG